MRANVPRQTSCRRWTSSCPCSTEVGLFHPEFDFSFETDRITNVALIKLASNVLKITGNWGTLKYQGLNHRIYNLHIKTPSDHKVVHLDPDQRRELSAGVPVLRSERRRHGDPGVFFVRAERLQPAAGAVQLRAGQPGDQGDADLRPEHRRKQALPPHQARHRRPGRPQPQGPPLLLLRRLEPQRCLRSRHQHGLR
jgi:hypothetical protein